MKENLSILFNKPDEVLSAFTDSAGRKTLKDFIPFNNIYSAGRLDYDSEGLLVVTSDGELIHRLTDPIHHIVKTYFAQVEGEYSLEKIEKIQKGIELKDYRTLPCRVQKIETPNFPDRSKKITPHGPVFWLRLELNEGKKHEIRKMTAAAGYPCLRLIRVAIGPIGMGELLPGQWRELTSQEVTKLKSSKAYR